jgi:hypothetical protein
MPGSAPSLASGLAAPALAVDMMGARRFANCYRMPGIRLHHHDPTSGPFMPTRAANISWERGNFTI